jgi:ribosome-associated toxin RatA of RatAB toxin-antitoxin module
MPRVYSVIEIPASPEAVYAVAKDIEKFPEYMPDVESLKIVQRDGPRLISEWVGRVEQFNRLIRWTEEDLWNDEKRRCDFHAIAGDWEHYEGVWTFTPSGDGTRVELTLEFAFNIPLIGPLIQGVLARLVQQNCDQMLCGLCNRVTGSA